MQQIHNIQSSDSDSSRNVFDVDRVRPVSSSNSSCQVAIFLNRLAFIADVDLKNGNLDNSLHNQRTI